MRYGNALYTVKVSNSFLLGLVSVLDVKTNHDHDCSISPFLGLDGNLYYFILINNVLTPLPNTISMGLDLV